MNIALKLVKFLLPENIRLKLRSKYLGGKFKRDVRDAWLNRVNSESDNHVEVYWKSKDQPNRIAMIDVTKKAIENFNMDNLSVLEFGSHVGVNLYLINEALVDKNVKFFAVEPNRDAVSFLKKMMPFVSVLEAEDEGFVTSKFPFQKIDICLVSAVFYCMSQKRTYEVLKKMSSICNCIIIGDELDNLDGGKTLQQKEDPYSLLHPYRSWLKELGFEHFEYFDAPVRKTAQNAFLVARKKL